MCGRPVWLKAENLQRTGSFKIRGAVSKVATLGPEERAAGVVTAVPAATARRSRGRRGRRASRRRSVPEDAPMARSTPREATAPTSCSQARIRRGGRGVQLEEAGADVHPRVRGRGRDRGQGTIGLELAEQLEESRVLVVPVGAAGSLRDRDRAQGAAARDPARGRPGSRVCAVAGAASSASRSRTASPA